MKLTQDIIDKFKKQCYIQKKMVALLEDDDEIVVQLAGTFIADKDLL